VTVAIRPLVGLVLVSLAVGRYRGDRRAVAGGIIAALGGTLGVALALPPANLVPTGKFTALASIAIVLAVLGSIYAEARLRRSQPSRLE
jgi:hypothetical protein